MAKKSYYSGRGMFSDNYKHKRKEWSTLGGLALANERGSDYMSEIGKRGAKASGFTIWSNEEKVYAERLIRFKEESRISYYDIAQILNRKYHKGKEIRNEISVRFEIKRLKKKRNRM